MINSKFKFILLFSLTIVISIILFASCDSDSFNDQEDSPPLSHFDDDEVSDNDNIAVAQSALNFMCGTDYSPNHFPGGADNARNTEPQSGVATELNQIRASEFNSVRMYNQPAKVWIPVIELANTMGLKVVYQVAACQSNTVTGECCVNVPTGGKNCMGSGLTLSTLVDQQQNVLEIVIQHVGQSVFNSTVEYVLVGNEDLFTCDPGVCTNPSNANFPTGGGLADQIGKIQNFLESINITVPVSFSIQGDVLIAKNDPGREELVKALKPGVDIGINVYPFQWGVPPDMGVYGQPCTAGNCDFCSGDSNMGCDLSSTVDCTCHSIDWYLTNLRQLYPNRDFFIAETGWATEGVNSQYACSGFKGRNGPCMPGVPEAKKFLFNLYQYAFERSQDFIVFEMFDEPSKKADPNNAENHYGVFDEVCDTKQNTVLVPSKSNYMPNDRGCTGDSSVFSIFGSCAKFNNKTSDTCEPAFVIEYALNASSPHVKVDVPLGVYGQINPTTMQIDIPWPQLLFQVGTMVVITSTAHKTQCSNEVASLGLDNRGGSWKNASPQGANKCGNGQAGCEGIVWGASPGCDGQNVSVSESF